MLWAYRITLAFGSELVAPVEVGLPTYRTRHFNQSQNDSALEEHLDILEEEREEAKVQNILNKKRQGVTLTNESSPGP